MLSNFPVPAEVQRGLAGGVTAPDYDDGATGELCGFRRRGAVVDPRADE